MLDAREHAPYAKLMPTPRIAPEPSCRLCSRLAAFRAENRAAHPEFHNKPVPAFGALEAKLLIVGLAPGLKGANRTGRPFTGDYAGDLLYATLARHGLTSGVYDERADDGFALVGVRITNAVRCVPPQNKPEPVEINTCRSFLAAEIASMKNLAAILTLGQIAHSSVCAALDLKKKDHKFTHGARYETAYGALVASYHCSRYNTNTGVLTEKMFNLVMAEAKRAAEL